MRAYQKKIHQMLPNSRFFRSWQHTHFRIQKISEISSVTKQEARARARAQVENKGQVVAHTRTTPFYCICLLCTILYVSRLFLISLLPWIDKPWENTLREKLYDPVRLRYINWGAKERQQSRRLFCHSQQLFLNKLVAEQHRKVLSTLITLVFANLHLHFASIPLFMPSFCQLGLNLIYVCSPIYVMLIMIAFTLCNLV